MQENKPNGPTPARSGKRLLTLGHGTLTQAAFVAVAADALIARVVDVRTAPGSKRNSHFNRESMAAWLPAAGISYRWEPRLGGFRKPLADSKNVALRHPAFRGYADYMQTPEFWHAFDELLEEAAATETAIMCSESVWWRCHRRLVADAAVLTRGVEVQNLSHDGRLVPHRVTDGARVQDGLVVYDVLTPPALLGHP
jgi:uncharacterized protein (DUF488 family)